MSARSKARKAALDLLYEADIRKSSASQIVQQRVTDLDYLIRDFTKELVTGVETHRRKIDELIITYSVGWDMDRMPNEVAIAEAVELASTLSTDDSSKYINGVLSKIVEIKADLAV